MRAISLAVALAVLSSTPFVALAQSDPYRLEAATDVRQELEEPQSMTTGHGQGNCVVEASIAGTDNCPLVETGKAYPPRGVRMLDSYFATFGYFEAARYADPALIGPPNTFIAAQDGVYHDAQRGDSLSRRAGTAPTILPGAAKFHAWYGLWNDSDGDHVIRSSQTSPRSSGPIWSPGPGNEWIISGTTTAGVVGAAVASFVEPGSHPNVGSYSRPRETQPDFVYKLLGGSAFWQSGSNQDVMLFTEGSLLQTIKVVTANDIVLIPGEDPRLPFTRLPTTLVDVDLYVAPTAGPIENTYVATLAPVTNAVGSPSVGLCPNRCQPGPVPLGDTPLEGPGGAATAALFAAYEHETDPGTTNSASGRLAEFQEGARAWVDLLVMNGVVSASDNIRVTMPLAGPSVNGERVLAPGLISFVARTGLWRDYNHDNYIGVVASDPYEGGSRPNPDDYDDSAGEFYPVGISTPQGGHNSNMTLILTPLTGWPDPGVLLVDPPAVLGAACKANPSLDTCVGEPRQILYTGMDPIVLYLSSSAIPSAGTVGVYSSTRHLLLPTGTLGGGFEACTEIVGIKYNTENGVAVETVFDCDILRGL